MEIARSCAKSDRKRERNSSAWRIAALAGLLLMSPQPRLEAQQISEGKAYYLDGAGGGGLLVNWGRGVVAGLRNAGYRGEIDNFSWQTQLGILADQHASVSYKRRKAGKLAEEIQSFQQQNPGAPVTLIGLSAGTAILLFTLEALPDTAKVENAILLSSSVSADYDLSRALRRVRGKMYVFTSENDSVLRFAVPISGTADRERGSRPAGLRGFTVPLGASPQVRSLYARVSHVAWSSIGGHTDVTRRSFVEEHIAPLVMRSIAGNPALQGGPTDGRVSNPDYERWQAFPVGSWITFSGRATIAESRHRALRVTDTLIARTDESVTIERRWELPDSGNEQQPPQRVVFPARIPPTEHPVTHPDTRHATGSTQPVTIDGRTLQSRVTTFTLDADIPRWGRNLRGEHWRSNELPGGVARTKLTALRSGEPFAYDATAVAFAIAAAPDAPTSARAD